MSAHDVTNRTEALIDLADKLASQPVPPVRERRRPGAAIAGGALLVAAVVGTGVVLSRGNNDDSSAGSADDSGTLVEPAPAASDATDEVSVQSEAALESTVTQTPAISVASQGPTVPTIATTAPATAAPTPAPTAPPTAPSATPVTIPVVTVGDVTPTADAPVTETTMIPTATADGGVVTVSPIDTIDVAAGEEVPIRWAEFSGFKVYLRGEVPDQATSDELLEIAARVVGAENVIVEYTIVPGSPRVAPAPLYVRDSVLFSPGSSRLNAQSQAVLDLGILLMQQNPAIRIDIQGHTDSDGTDEYNMRLSQERVDTIHEYATSMGIDPSRLSSQAFGESRPIADNHTEDGKAKNRRVEFTLHDVLT
jgi:outer membrane protein OmpA-like peptidoglycan-associated protein